MNFCKYLPKSETNIPEVKEVKKSVSFMVEASPYNENVYQETTKRNNKNKRDEGKINVQQYNIFDIDTKIKENLNKNISSVDELYKDLSLMLSLLNSDGKDQMRKFTAKQKTDMLRKRIKDAESTMELARYIYRTEDLLKKYREISKGGVSFINNGTDENRVNKGKIIDRFLCIAQEYIKLENIPFKAKKLLCPSCSSPNIQLSIQDDSIYLCDECGAQIEILDDTPCFKDTDRVNLSSKYKYSTKGHFTVAFKRFQGNQNTDPVKLESTVEIIKREMLQHNLVAENGFKNSITKDHIYMFLAEQELSRHYDDINLLWHLVTGGPCPDLSAHAGGIFDDFDQMEKVLQEIIKEDDRTNTLTVNYKLYKILQHRGIPCKKDDFYILRTDMKKDEHDEKMKEVFARLNWKWVPTF